MTTATQIDAQLIYPTQAEIPQVATTTAITTPFPTNTCIVAPGVIELMGTSESGCLFDLSSVPEGCFSWFGFDKVTGWQAGGRLVLSITAANGGDPYALAKGLSLMLGYGMANSGASPSSAFCQARYGTIYGLCGDLAVWYTAAFQQQGYQTRIIEFSDSVQNGWDDGHTCFEVLFGDGWKFFDSYGHYWTDSNDNHLSLAEIITAGGPQNCQLVHLRQPPWPAYLSEGTNDWASAALWPARAYADLYQHDDAQYVVWAQRVYAIPGITSSESATPTAYLPSGAEANQSRLQAAGWTIVSQPAWLSEFYPNNGLTS